MTPFAARCGKETGTLAPAPCAPPRPPPAGPRPGPPPHGARKRGHAPANSANSVDARIAPFNGRAARTRTDERQEFSGPTAGTCIHQGMTPEKAHSQGHGPVRARCGKENGTLAPAPCAPPRPPPAGPRPGPPPHGARKRGHAPANSANSVDARIAPFNGRAARTRTDERQEFSGPTAGTCIHQGMTPEKVHSQGHDPVRRSVRAGDRDARAGPVRATPTSPAGPRPGPPPHGARKQGHAPANAAISGSCLSGGTNRALQRPRGPDAQGRTPRVRGADRPDVHPPGDDSRKGSLAGA